MTRQTKKILTIAAVSFAAWWIFGRKVSAIVGEASNDVSPSVGPVGAGISENGIPGVARPGKVRRSKIQPMPSSGTVEMKARQSQLARRMKTVLATRPTPLLVKTADIQRSMQNAFKRLTLTTTGKVNVEGGAVARSNQLTLQHKRSLQKRKPLGAA